MPFTNKDSTLHSSSKIFVAGHRGLVGSAVLRWLQANGYANIILRTHGELDLKNQSAVNQFFATERPEYVFLAAAKVGGILANSTYKADFLNDNLLISTNVIEASYRNGVKKLLNLGSSCIYPKLAPQPIREDYLLTGPLESTNEPYAIAKIAAIKLCRYYNEQYGTNFISGMPTNVYGINDNFNLETSHVLPALIRKFHLAKLWQEKQTNKLIADLHHRTIGFGYTLDQEADESALEALLAKLGIYRNALTLWGTGSPYREFIFADDLADACVFLMERCNAKDTGELVNIGVGHDHQIKELASLIKSIVGYKGEIRFDPSKPDGTPRKLLDISRLTNLGWKAKTPLEEGIGKTYDWYQNAVVN